MTRLICNTCVRSGVVRCAYNAYASTLPFDPVPGWETYVPLTCGLSSRIRRDPPSRPPRFPEMPLFCRDGKGRAEKVLPDEEDRARARSRVRHRAAGLTSGLELSRLGVGNYQAPSYRRHSSQGHVSPPRVATMSRFRLAETIDRSPNDTSLDSMTARRFPMIHHRRRGGARFRR